MLHCKTKMCCIEILMDENFIAITVHIKDHENILCQSTLIEQSF